MTSLPSHVCVVYPCSVAGTAIASWRWHIETRNSDLNDQIIATYKQARKFSSSANTSLEKYSTLDQEIAALNHNSAEAILTFPIVFKSTFNNLYNKSWTQQTTLFISRVLDNSQVMNPLTTTANKQTLSICVVSVTSFKLLIFTTMNGLLEILELRTLTTDTLSRLTPSSRTENGSNH